MRTGRSERLRDGGSTAGDGADLIDWERARSSRVRQTTHALAPDRSVEHHGIIAWFPDRRNGQCRQWFCPSPSIWSGTIGRSTIHPLLSPTRLLSEWDRLRSSFWFLPATMTTVAAALSLILVEFDGWLGEDTVQEAGWLYAFGPEGARAILAAVASSMITVAGLTFSMTMLTLQLASSQFGPRLLRDFMRDKGNQFVLGTFIATFLYCLLVLRTVRGTEESSFVPHVAVAFGVVLAIASLAVLIYFIHHVATSIRIENVLGQLARETGEVIDRLFPERSGKGVEEAKYAGVRLPDDFETGSRPIPIEASGYVQRMDEQALFELATQYDLVLCVEARPGRFVTDDTAVVAAYPAERVSGEIAAELCGAIVVGAERTPHQDLEFSIRRIVEIAQRALSPGINDPTTAIYCIDRLGEALLRLATRDMPSSRRLDEAGRLRVVADVVTLEALACSSFAAVARYGVGDRDVVRHLVEVIERLSRRTDAATSHSLATLGRAIRAENHRLALDFDRP